MGKNMGLRLTQSTIMPKEIQLAGNSSIPMTPCFIFVPTLDTCLIVQQGWRIDERLQKVTFLLYLKLTLDQEEKGLTHLPIS
jgi:hypothetical protein